MLVIIYSITLLPCLASFLSVFVERGKLGKSLGGRSYCVCGKLINWYNNIPVISYIYLSGKSKCCNAKIPSWYFYSELLSLILGLFLSIILNWLGFILNVLIQISIATYFRFKK